MKTVTLSVHSVANQLMTGLIILFPRLESYANRNLQVEGVQVEKILLHNEPLTQIINETNHVYSAQSCLIEDRVSKQILNEHNMCIKDRKPIQVSSDGNCLFNSLSVDIVGNESLAPRLRVHVLTCIELVSNKSIYDTNKYDHLRLVSLSYDETCKDAATDKAFSSA